MCLPRHFARFAVAMFAAVTALATTIETGEARAGAASRDAAITSFPKSLDKDCRDGRAKMFDECGDQAALFVRALKQARKEGKVLLVSYGAEWCIWCHVFEQYIAGGRTQFTYTYSAPDDLDRFETSTLYERETHDVSGEAAALRDFVARSFVVVHIDAQYAPNGANIMWATGANRHYAGSIPFIFTVTSDGRFAARLDPDRVETRRDGMFDWYRGYDRSRLQAELSALHEAAQ